MRMSEQDKNPVQIGDPATEPIDLAQAFKMYNEANRTPAEQPVETGEPAEPVAEGGAGEQGSGEPEAPEGAGESMETVAPADDGAGDDGSGGSADVVEPVDFNARRQELLQDIQRQAIAEVRQEFANNQINPCTIEELYQRDEQTGRVTFKNPDDPQHDFASRAEAQAWVDAFNKQIEMRFRQEINAKQRELVQQRAPQLRLIEFASTFNSMSKAEQDIMDDLIEPYAVKDSGGNVVGFNVDLNAVANQARKIAAKFAQEAPAANAPEDSQEPQEAPGRPAMNMPTGTGQSSDRAEPKSIGEALKMYDKSQREKGKK